jgi:hypothetical protein
MWRVTCIMYVLLCHGLQLEAMAQGTFNRRFNPTGGSYMAELAWSVQERDGGYMVFGNGDWTWQEDSTWFYTSSVLWNLALDGQGLLVSQNQYWDSTTADYPGYASSAVRLDNGKFALGGGNYQMDGTQAPIIYFIDDLGAVDSLKIYGVQGEEWIGRQVRHCRDGGFALVGDYANALGANGFLLRTDSTGTLQWIQTYGGAGVDVITSIDTVGTGCYLGGEWNIFGNDPQLWAQRVDGMGAVIWQATWGGAYEDPTAYVRTLSNGHALVASSWSYSANFGSLRLYLAELDSADGSLVWEQQYDMASPETRIFSVKEISPGGDLICTGQSYVGAPSRGFLLRTTNQGDSLWMRYYEYGDSIVNRGRGWLRDGMPTSDGGFIAVGTALGTSNDPNDPPAYSQDMWVIKTDSMGCLVPGCDLITGMTSQVTNLRDALTLWPNPTAGELEVNVALPGNGPPEAPLRLVVTSLDGRMVQERNLPAERNQQMRLDLGQEAAGLYCVHLVEGGRWLAGLKVVVE